MSDVGFTVSIEGGVADAVGDGVGVTGGEAVGVGGGVAEGELVTDGLGVTLGTYPLPLPCVQLTIASTSETATNRRTRTRISRIFRGTMHSHMSIQPYRFASLAIALAAFALFLLLGRAVDHAPDPGWMMIHEIGWVNHATLIAWWITWFGFFQALLPIGVALAIVAIVVPAWRSRLTFAIVSLLIAWRGTDAWQHFFARPRRLDWVIKHETAFSYPSSHTAIAVAFYLVLAYFVARSTLPGRVWIAAAIGVLAVAIMWSRLALGAHYLTDIAGGALWGTAIVATLAACWPTNVSRNVVEGRAGATLE
ncbi:MAG: phosphatase PAP2 family protein [Candidatus Aquilonibacter sp.]